MRNNFLKTYILKTSQTFFCPIYRLSRTINDVDVTMNVSYVVFRSWCKNLQICSFFSSGMLKSLNYKAFSLTRPISMQVYWNKRKLFPPPPPPAGFTQQKCFTAVKSCENALYIPIHNFCAANKTISERVLVCNSTVCFGQTSVLFTENLALILVRFPS